jgi:predicted N-acyltransferase
LADDAADRIELYSCPLPKQMAAVDRAQLERDREPAGRALRPLPRLGLSGSARKQPAARSPETGWTPRHMLAHDAAGKLVGAAPLYLKMHSRGEFVFDHSWADALHRAGGRYYPKLLCAVPFTPVTGRRLLAAGPNALSIRHALARRS